MEFATAPKLIQHIIHNRTFYNFTVSSYIDSVYPDLFNMVCFDSKTRLISRQSVPKRDLYVTIDYKGGTEQDNLYNCTVEHINSGQTKTYSLVIFESITVCGEQNEILSNN